MQLIKNNGVFQIAHLIDVDSVNLLFFKNWKILTINFIGKPFILVNIHRAYLWKRSWPNSSFICRITLKADRSTFPSLQRSFLVAGIG
jgi:hypothetical protein